MALDADAILARTDVLHGCIGAQCQALLGLHAQNPRLAAVFATQQRWLLAHAGLALFFAGDDGDRQGLVAARFLEMVALHAIASRNTAAAFFKEMLHYQFIRPIAGRAGKRMRPMEPTEQTMAAVTGWLSVHLHTLDGLDGGARLAAFNARPGMLADIQPHIAEGLLRSNAVREPERTFSLFTWLNNGGAVMDWLIAGITDAAPDSERIRTSVVSVTEMAGWLRLSRTHLSRKLREAEALGSIGWEGAHGQSVMWVSKGFRQEYTRAQAIKLAIIDSAFDVASATAQTGNVAAAGMRISRA